MANLTDNGSTGWFTVSARHSALAEGNGTWGSGSPSLALEVKSKVDNSTAVPLTQIDGTAITFSADFAVVIDNPDSNPRDYRFTLTGATSPDLDLTIE